MHARSRRAAVLGLILQALVFGVTLVLAFATAGPEAPYSRPLYHLAWYLAGGLPIWLGALLVFRQRELADLEALDLEILRREKAASGGGQALFDESGFRVAETRLKWMQRWLLPFFGLVVGLFLTLMGLSLLTALWQQGLRPPFMEGSGRWSTPQHASIAMIVLAISMLVTFLYSRYTSGMGRVAGWQLLRGCGSYLLGNALVIVALIVSLGVNTYSRGNQPAGEQALAFVIPALMVILGVETLLNLVFDIYRPRTPGVEPRAAFDSRLLGLFAEPGGIASSIAEAINYQFGFEVSQTWFYRVLQRAAVPLIVLGSLVLWLLTCIVVVEPEQHLIVERWGRQLTTGSGADAQLAVHGPGLYFKLPWPIDVARKYPTTAVQQVYIGFARYDAEPAAEELHKTGAVQWTDPQHLGMEHWDFLVPLGSRGMEATGDGADESGARAVPVNLIRMDAVVQYRIRAAELDRYTNALADATRTLRNVAWREAMLVNATHDVDALLGDLRRTLGHQLRERIQRRADELGLGVEIVYVGLQNIHPEKTVAEAFRNVVNAEQQKFATIREAMVTESETLSRVAGDRTRARRLAYAVNRLTTNEQQLSVTERVLGRLDAETVRRFRAALAERAPLFAAAEQTRWLVDQARDQRQLVESAFELGMRYTQSEQRAAAERVLAAERDAQASQDELAAALAPLRTEIEQALGAAAAEALLNATAAQVALSFWNAEIERQITGLQGAAAVTLAEARAQRWAIEMQTAAEVTRLLNERDAYQAAPQVYRTRLFLQALVDGYRNSRKYFLAFEPRGRRVHLRYQAEEQARPGLEMLEAEQPR